MDLSLLGKLGRRNDVHTWHDSAWRRIQQASQCAGVATGPIFEGYGARIAKDEFDITKETPGMTTTLAMKDLRHIRDLARDSKA